MHPKSLSNFWGAYQKGAFIILIVFTKLSKLFWRNTKHFLKRCMKLRNRRVSYAKSNFLYAHIRAREKALCIGKLHFDKIVIMRL